MPTVTNNITVSAVGASVLNTASPSAVSWIRVNADNTITYRTAAQTLSDLGAQAAGTYLVPADIGVTVQGYNANTTILGNSVTGSGNIVLATSPTIGTSFTLDYGTASTVVYLNASKQLISLANASGVLTNDGSGGLTWAAVAGGISIGDAIGNSPVTGSALMAIGGVVTQSISYRAQQATPFSTAFGYTAHSSASFSGVRNSSFGYEAGLSLTTGTDNTFIGQGAGRLPTTSSQNVAIGSGALQQGGGSTNVAIGYQALFPATSATTNTIGIGYRAGYLSGNPAGARCIYIGVSAAENGAAGINSAIVIGYAQAAPSTSNTGILGSTDSNGHIDNWYFNGMTHTAPYGVNIRASGGNGSNINGANLSFYAGLPTGDGSNTAAGRNGYMSFWTGDVGASGTTLRSATEKARLVQGGDFVLGITSDTKGLVLKSPDGHYWRITVDNAGVLGIADTGTSIPT